MNFFYILRLNLVNIPLLYQKINHNLVEYFKQYIAIMKKEFTPKLFSLLREGLSKETITKDILSGLIVGIVFKGRSF